MESSEYIGWIPCINGHLDFGLMRVGIKGGFTNTESKDSNVIEVNFSCSHHEDSHHRRIVLQSKVNWRDSVIYPEEDGAFRVVVVAEVNESQSMDERYLDGHLLIYPASGEPKEVDLRNKMNIHILCHSIERDKTNRHINFHYLMKIVSGQEDVDDLNLFSCSVKFRVEPNGLTKLKCNPIGTELNKQSAYIISRQAFYYLKYAIHTHKHHIAEQDSLTTITPIETNTENKKSDAGLRLICQLKRELTVLQRIQNTDGKEHTTNNAIGIIAYVKSLICSLKDSGFLKNEIAERELDRFNHINESFVAQNCKIANEINNLELIKSKSKVWLGFFIVSMWASLRLLLENNEKIQATNAELFVYVLSVLAAAFIAYIMIKKFYNERQSPEALEYLYKISYKKILIKMVLAVFFILVLINNFQAMFVI